VREAKEVDKNGFLIDLSESERTDFGRADFEDQSEPQKVFSAIWALESEVNNGGFDQHFRNTESDVIAFAPTALRKIGAESCAAIVARAIDIIVPLPETEEERHEALDRLGEKGEEQLSALDGEFYEYPDDLTDMLYRYVEQHPEEFGSVPGVNGA
jgi:hypothetical protein